MGNCSGKSIFYDRIYPKFITPYLTIFITVLSFFNPNDVFCQSDYAIRTVVIDAGHGGRDPGAVGKITYEKHITLAVALKLGKYIEQHLKDVNVVYTRTGDKFIPLDERSQIANEAKADVFISIHVNSLENRQVHGTSSWVMGLHVSEENLEIAKRENSVIKYESNHSAKYEGYDPHSAESFIIFSLMQNEYLNQSLDLASKIQNQFKKRLGRKDRGVNQAGFVVLWKTSMPAVLVETGFISNAKEERFLASAQGQDYIASAIFRAFRDFKKNLEGKRPPITNDKNTTPQVIEKKHNVWFSVQILSSEKKIPTSGSVFRNLPKVSEQKQGNIYKYYAGHYGNYKSASELKEKIAKRFPGLFVVAFEDGKRISVKEAITKTGS